MLLIAYFICCRNPPYRAPWARISTYTGKRIKKCGQVTKQVVVCYPRDVHTQNCSSGQFAPALIPGDRVYVKLGVSPAPGVTVTLHGLPPQFLLAVAYVETLVTETFGCGMNACGNKMEKTCGPREGIALSISGGSSCTSPMNAEVSETNESLWSLDNIHVTPPVFLHIIEFLCGFLWKTDVSALVKEYLFHLLAQTMRILRYSEGCQGSSLLAKLSTRLSPTQGMLTALPRELKKLYDLEAKNMPEMTTTAGHGIGLGVTDTNRWSTYLLALMEVCLAISEVIPCEISVCKEPTEALVEDSAAGTSCALAAGSSSSGKKKKLKPKKERNPASTRMPSQDQRGPTDGTDSDVSASSSTVNISQSLDTQTAISVGVISVQPIKASSNSSICTISNASSSTSIKVDDMAWFPLAVSTAKLLRYLALKEPHCQEQVNEAVKAAAMALSSPTSHSRLLVITGIPTYLDLPTVKKSIRKVCNSFGGLDRDEIFVPTPNDFNILDSKGATPQLVSVSSSIDTVSTPTSTSNESKADSSMPQPATPTTPTIDSKKKSKLIEGYCVICLPSKTKIDIVRKAFLKSKWLNLNLGEEPDTNMEAPDENLNVQTVSPVLLTEPEANSALESYLSYKISGKIGGQTLGPAANQALTEVFYSCYFVDQQQDSGDICLCKDQIMNPASENLLGPFFNAVRPAKKPLAEAVTAVLRQYGIQKSQDKDT